jgi:hypothetical protein
LTGKKFRTNATPRNISREISSELRSRRISTQHAVHLTIFQPATACMPTAIDGSSKMISLCAKLSIGFVTTTSFFADAVDLHLRATSSQRFRKSEQESFSLSDLAALFNNDPEYSQLFSGSTARDNTKALTDETDARMEAVRMMLRAQQLSFSLPPISAQSEVPSTVPSALVSEAPSDVPSFHPSVLVSEFPSDVPSFHPSKRVTEYPSDVPSYHPSVQVSEFPSDVPSYHPSKQVTEYPSDVPSYHPSVQVSESPSDVPSYHPSAQDSEYPSDVPSSHPSAQVSDFPSDVPSQNPAYAEPGFPTITVSEFPSNVPSALFYPLSGCQSSGARRSQILALLESHADPTAIHNHSTPQGMATAWLIHQDPLHLCPGDTTSRQLLQRWALAVLYYTTNGDAWTSCSANGSGGCGSIAPFDQSQSSFLSAASECSWAGINCTHNRVTKIELINNSLAGK